MATIRKASDYSDWRFRMAGFGNYGQLWDVESVSPRYSVFAGRFPSGVWHVLYPGGDFRTLAEGGTRAEAIANYERKLAQRAA